MLRLVIDLEEQQLVDEMPEDEYFINLGSVGSNYAFKNIKEISLKHLTSRFCFLRTTEEQGSGLKGHLIKGFKIITNIGEKDGKK